MTAEIKRKQMFYICLFFEKRKKETEREKSSTSSSSEDQACVCPSEVQKYFCRRLSPPPPLLASPVICSCSFLFSQNYRDGTFDWSKHHRQTKIVCHGEKISIPETFWERCLACGLQRFSIHEGHLARTIEIEARDMVNNVYQID